MTTLTTTDWLARGIVTSMMFEESALVESVSVNGEIMSVAFVNGMPMPWETFSMLMLYRMAPNAVANIYDQQKQAQNDKRSYLPDVHVQKLHRLIRRDARLPAIHKPGVGEDLVSKAEKAVGALYSRVANTHPTDMKICHDAFTEMMVRIEECYANSLIDPQIMSAEVFNFDDDGIVADQFRDNCLDLF